MARDAMKTSRPSPLARGALLALSSAVLFGASTPLLRVCGNGVGPWSTAALLYTGAVCVGLIGGGLRGGRTRLRPGLTSRLVVAAFCGAALGPAALAWGVQRTSAVSASLMLNLEAVLTVGLAALFYREPIGRRVALAAGLIVSGGVLLVIERSGFGSVEMWGLLGAAVATIMWALDNTIARPLADWDTGVIVIRKAALGTLISLIVALISGEMYPPIAKVAALILIGAFGYGLSLYLYLLSQRQFGAARTASVFAAGPFLGAALAFAIGDRTFELWAVLGGILMLIGVVLHITERHEHHHAHQAIGHEHVHRHDDLHHSHSHEQPLDGEHSHGHSHQAIRHSHPHAPDLHHVHGHQ